MILISSKIAIEKFEIVKLYSLGVLYDISVNKFYHSDLNFHYTIVVIRESIEIKILKRTYKFWN